MKRLSSDTDETYIERTICLSEFERGFTDGANPKKWRGAKDGSNPRFAHYRLGLQHGRMAFEHAREAYGNVLTVPQELPVEPGAAYDVRLLQTLRGGSR